ncbi:hypothetical protein [Haloferula sp. BvORR071]|uniref:hypothetical protein n=1 Tax=Haloferula sp. BvORR071 TaxID=1396141 RepID=UPI000555935B|nr:hypothetical protein [Haloferula sp. BvORR071]
MLPQKRIEAQDGEDGHGGLKVRVIGGGAASPAGEREVRNLEIGLRIGGGTARKLVRDEPEDEGPVHRLEAGDMMDPVQARDMSEVGPAEPRVSRSQAKRRNITRWTVGMGIGTCALVAVAVVAQLKGRNAQSASPQVAPVEIQAKLDPRAEERAYWLNNFESLFPQAVELLKRYAAAKSADEVLPLIRHADRVHDQVLANWRPWGSDEFLAYGTKVSNFIEDNPAWESLTLVGKKGNFEPFEVKIVREGSELKVDWEATCGEGDFTVAQLHAGSKAKDSLVRVKVSPAKLFTPDYPEADYYSYQLTDLTGEDFVWAFVPKSSPEAEFLRKDLDENSRILSAAKSVPLILKVTGPHAPGVNVFLITEVLHKGWVTP